MNCPIPSITPEEEQEATEALLKSGARILEINAVRPQHFRYQRRPSGA